MEPGLSSPTSEKVAAIVCSTVLAAKYSSGRIVVNVKDRTRLQLYRITAIFIVFD
jgi:hypothetical protein